MLAKLGQAADLGDLNPDELAPDALKTQEAADPATGKKTEPSPDDAGDKSPEAQPGDDPKKAKAPQPPEKKEGDEKETDYTRAQKEEQRREKSWQALEQEKAQVRAEKEALERQKAELQQQQEAKPPASQALKDDRGFSADDYERFAKDEEAAGGDPKLIAEARDTAKTLRDREAKAAQETQHKQHTQAWWDTANKVVASKPELQKLDTPLAKEVTALLKGEPLFHAHPEGFQKAVEIAEARLAAAEVPSLKTEIETLRKKLQEAEAKLAPEPDTVQRPPKEKAIADLSVDEAEREIRKMASQLDHELAA